MAKPIALTDDQLMIIMRAAEPLPPNTADRLISTVGKLESVPDISELVSVMTGR